MQLTLYSMWTLVGTSVWLADLWKDDEGSSHNREDNVDPKQPAEENEVGGHARPKVTSSRQRTTSEADNQWYSGSQALIAFVFSPI